LNIALFVAGGLWLLAAEMASSHVAQGIVDHLNLAVVDPLLQQGTLVVLLLFGFTALNGVASRSLNLRSANALPKRPTTGQEWLRGAALGWGMLLAVAVPMMLLGVLHPQVWLAAHSWGLALLSLVTLALMTLALELAFRGYPFLRLIAAVGPFAATVVLSLVYALLSLLRPNSTAWSFAVTFVMGVLFSMAYLRTHALWLGWGIHFAWNAAMAVLLGLPVAGDANYSSLVTTTASGPVWFSGGWYGPEGAAPSIVITLAALAVLYRLTRNYAWEYTHPPIIAMGYPVTIAPPAAHTAMEDAAAAQPAPLVQILATTSTSSSTLPIIDDHLRSGAGTEKAD
jgi:membrane protease YdiL (CAAX protease family)